MTRRIDVRRYLILYARSRSLLAIIVSSLVLLALGSGWVWWSRDRWSDQVLAQTVPALFAGILLGTSVASPFGELEDAVPELPQAFRFAGFVVLTCALSAVFMAGSVFWQRSDAPASLVRGLLGFSGLTVIAQRWLGPSRAWIPALTWGMLALFSTQAEWTYPAWAWSMQPGDDAVSWLLAIGLFVAGIAVLTRSPFSAAD